MRIPAVQGSSNPKTSSSHSLSVSPTLNIPALVVEAAASRLSFDHGKLLVNKGAQYSSTFISKKHIDAKPNAMSGTYIKLNSRVNIVGEAFHGKNASLVDTTMKCRSHEGFKILSKNSSSDTRKGSSKLGSGHIEIARSERTDAALVSSGIVCVGLSKDRFPICVPQRNNYLVFILISIINLFEYHHFQAITTS